MARAPKGTKPPAKSDVPSPTAAPGLAMAGAAGKPARPPRLSEAEIEVSLKAVSEWSHVGEVIQRTYQFPDFVAAMRFVNEVALEAERTQHHPDILIRYNKVSLSLATHEVEGGGTGGITMKDFDLAAKVDQIFGAKATN